MINENHYIIFASVGFVNGIIDLWNSFKEDTCTLKKIAPSITNGIVWAVGYSSIPYFSSTILENLVKI